jgi:glycerophosphoryl diester phosphodiesterase
MMAMPVWIENAFYRMSDLLSARLPQPIPKKGNLLKTRLISHRGVYDNKTVFENTLSAFNPVKIHGAWGIEVDIQWTKDLTPVVFHDPDCRRLFADRLKIAELSLRALKSRYPMIPTLAEVIFEYGTCLHLMVELKNKFTAAERQNEILSALFSGLIPVQDFHLMSLRPQFFHPVTFAPPEAFIPIAQLNVNTVSDMVLKNGYGGMCAHYMLLRDSVIKKLSRQRLPVGSGFINSKYCFFREVNRGVTWIFSDRVIEIQKLLQTLPVK